VWNKLAALPRVLLEIRALGLLFITGIMLIILAIKVPPYTTLDNFRVLGLQMTEVGIVAVGMTLLIIGGNIDLSVGSMTGMIATASALLSLSLPEPWPLIFGVGIGGLCGLFNGILVWRVRLSPIIITVGSLSLFYGIGLVLNSGTAVGGVPESFSNFGSIDIWGFSIGFVIFLALCLGAWVFLATTRTGRHLYAIGGNREAATRVGIPVRRFVVATFVLSGLLTGLGAVLLASRFGTGDVSYGLNLEIQVITAVLLGGVAFSGGEGGIGGVLMAVIFLTVLETGIVALGVNPYYSDIVQGAALIAAVTLEQFTSEQRARRQRALARSDAPPAASGANATGAGARNLLTRRPPLHEDTSMKDVT